MAPFSSLEDTLNMITLPFTACLYQGNEPEIDDPIAFNYPQFFEFERETVSEPRTGNEAEGGALAYGKEMYHICCILGVIMISTHSIGGCNAFQYFCSIYWLWVLKYHDCSR
jgi:hypothetical protein